GPSVSWAEDKPITITDTVPGGVNNVENPSGDPESGSAGWEARVDGGFPANAGVTITWTYLPAEGISWMPVGTAPVITLSGTIEPSWIGGDEITNTATVAPGDIPYEDDTNNEADVTVEPTDDTSISVSKSRVAWDGSAWVTPD